MVSPSQSSKAFDTSAACGAEVAQVVIAQAAADDQHAFVAQRRDRAAERQVLGRIEPDASDSCTTGTSACG